METLRLEWEGTRVNDDAVFSEFEALAEDVEVDEPALHAEARRIGSDLAGLRSLVERYGRSDNVPLVRAVTHALASAPWEFAHPTRQLNELVFELLRGAGDSGDAGTLTGCVAALQGLSARRLLALGTEEDRVALNGFLSRCLDHPDPTVRGDCLQLLGYLWANGTLERLLDDEVASVLRARLPHLGDETGGKFHDELAAFHDELAALSDFLDAGVA